MAFPEPQYSLVIETLAFPEPKYSGVLRHLLHQLCFLAGADITEVFTREGEDAILPCALDSPVDLTDEAFDLKKGKQEVFFYRQGKDYNDGLGGQDPHYVGRVHLLPGGLQAGNASVVLSGVTQADSGVYKCVILAKWTQSNRDILLTVVVEPRLRLEVVEAPPSSGWVRLSCVSRGGQPQPSGLEWQTPNGTVIPAEEAPPAASSDGDGRYSISQTVKVTEPGSYTCLARQQGVHPAVRDTIRVVGHWVTGDHEKVLGNGPWKAIGADITEVFTREGEDAILPCALGSPVDLTDEAFDLKKGKQEVFFYRQGKDYNDGLGGQDPHYVGRVHLLPGGLQAGNASVVLSGVTQADSGVYKCVILAKRTQSNRDILLTVVVEPRLRLEVVEASPSSGSVRLSCVSRGGQPQPSGLEWQTPNGTVIPAEEAPPAASSDSVGRDSISQTVKVTEPGSYTCLARQQGVHPAVRDTIRVFGHWLTGDREEVLGNGPWKAIGAGIPEVVTNLGDTDTEKEQQEVFFYEKGKHYDNGKRGQDLQFGGRVHLLPGALQAGNASVILSSVTQADGGVYSCYFPRRKLTRWIRLTVGEEAILPCGLGSPVNLKDEVFDWKKEQQEVFFYEKGNDYNNGKPGQDPQFVAGWAFSQGGCRQVTPL
ncbi:unnamed protein product [Gadus morhua 'NCC']